MIPLQVLQKVEETIALLREKSNVLTGEFSDGVSGKGVGFDSRSSIFSVRREAKLLAKSQGARLRLEYGV